MLTAVDDLGLRNILHKEKLVDAFFNKPVQGDILRQKIAEILQD
jgi:lipid A disaccharide synthetase